MDHSIPLDNALGLLDLLQTMLNEKVSSTDSMTMFFENFPFAAWVKDINGKLLTVNAAYKRDYNVRVISDVEVDLQMPGYVLNQYAVNDLWILNYKVPRLFVEDAPKDNEPNRKINVLKFPVFSHMGELLGTAGVELPQMIRELLNVK